MKFILALSLLLTACLSAGPAAEKPQSPDPAEGSSLMAHFEKIKQTLSWTSGGGNTLASAAINTESGEIILSWAQGAQTTDPVPKLVLDKPDSENSIASTAVILPLANGICLIFRCDNPDADTEITLTLELLAAVNTEELFKPSGIRIPEFSETLEEEPSELNWDSPDSSGESVGILQTRGTSTKIRRKKTENSLQLYIQQHMGGAEAPVKNIPLHIWNDPESSQTWLFTMRYPLLNMKMLPYLQVKAVVREAAIHQ